MSIVLSPSFIFPPVDWWRQIITCDQVMLKEAEPFRKMTWRNRYRIATANGPLLLSIPVAGGRTQSAHTGNVDIDAQQDWQKQHWRSLFSAYGRAPFFEHYGPPLEQLLQQPIQKLTDFNLQALEWVRRELRLSIVFTSINDTEQAPENDFMDLSQSSFTEEAQPLVYSQVFEDRHGFIPNLSILDLLMNEGPAAKSILMGK